MSYNNNLRQDIIWSITSPADPKISGLMLQQKLLAIVDAIGAGGVFLGTAATDTVPGTAVNGFYLATTVGTYTNFIDTSAKPLVIAEGEIALLSSIEQNGNIRWAKNPLPGRGEAAYLHIMYAESQPAQDSDMHDTFQQATDKYIGICADANETAPTDYRLYTWAKFVGEDGAPGRDAINPFKGWFDADITGEVGSRVIDNEANLPASPSVGFYAYVKTIEVDPQDTSIETDVVKIYECATAGQWSDSGRTFQPSNDPAFKSGQSLNAVGIDGTHLANAVSDDEENAPMLAKASDVQLLKQQLRGVDLTETKAAYTSDNVITGSNGRNVYITITNGVLTLNETSVNSSNYFKSVKIPISSGNRIRFSGPVRPESPTVYAYGFLDENSKPIQDGAKVYDYDAAASEWAVKEYFIDSIPSGAAYFVCNIKISTVSNSVYTVQFSESNFYCYIQNGKPVGEVVNAISNMVDIPRTDNIIITKNGLPSANILNNYYISSNGTITASNGSACAIIPLNDALEVEVTGLSFSDISAYDRGFIFVKDIGTVKGTNLYGGTVVKVIPYSKVGNSTVVKEYTLEVPEGATHLKCNITVSSYYPLNSFSCILRERNTITKELNSLKKELTIVPCGGIELFNGDIGDDGNFIESNTCLVSKPINTNNGINLVVRNNNENHYIATVSLVEHTTGEIVNSQFQKRTSFYPSYQSLGIDAISPAYDVILRIKRSDDGVITNKDVIVEFSSLVDLEFDKVTPENITDNIFKLFKKKLNTFRTPYVPLRDMPQNSTNTYKFVKGNTYVGIPYSGAYQWHKFVGIDVSIRTFATAMANPRSVMYTESLITTPNVVTKYGFAHYGNNSESRTFYGAVCTALTSYLAGFEYQLTSNNWKNNSMFNVIMEGVMDSDVITVGNETYSYFDSTDINTLAKMLQPMDFLWNTGHCAVISDIYRDEYGDVKYIVVSEESGQLYISRIYTTAYFFYRYYVRVMGQEGWGKKDWRVLRRKTTDAYKWTDEMVSIPRAEGDTEYALMDKSMFAPIATIETNPDMACFAGEYAAFAIGEDVPNDRYNNFKLFLNIHRGGASGYNFLQVFAEDDDNTVIAEIDISTNGGFVAQSDILSEDSSDNEDWIIYNLGSYWYTNLRNVVGKYKARVVRKESGSVVKTSNYSHFLMVKIDYNLGELTVAGGQPVEIREELWIESVSGQDTGLGISFSITKDGTLNGFDVYKVTNIGDVLISGAKRRLIVRSEYGTCCYVLT